MGASPFPFLLLRADLLFHFPKCWCVLVSTEKQHSLSPKAAKADEVMPSYMSKGPFPTVDQVKEENLWLPTAVKVEEGNNLLQVLSVRQMVLASPEKQTVYGMGMQITNPGSVDLSAR